MHTLRSKSYLFLLLVLGLGILSGFLYSQTKYNYGLDVRGGIRLRYEMQLRDDQRAESELIRSRLITILQGRAQGPMAVAEPAISAKGDNQIVVELPGATDIKLAREVIGTSAKIQFYHAKNVQTPRSSFRPFQIAADSDSGSRQPEVSFNRASGGEPIKFGDPEYKRIIDGWDLILEGEDLASASADIAGSTYRPLMNFSGEGARKMEAWSRRYLNQRENIAAVLDGKVLSIASVNDNTILSTNAVITGTFEPAYVTSLVSLLNAGALPVDLKEESSERVDPTIGSQALEKIIFAGAISFGLIAVFMVVYYALPGFVAVVALLLYTLFTLTVLKLANATFSLAAIAGFILSLSMAVDANILVFERFKEEMKRGKSLQTSIDLGFKRALSAIVDSNACTVLTSMVLVYLGTGPVKGFATTLIIGVTISLFTAITVTRSLLVFLVNSGIASNQKFYLVERNWFGEKFERRAETDPLGIVQKSKKWFVLSALVIVVTLPFVYPLKGLKPNVEFMGGYEASFSIAGKDVTPATIRTNLEKAGYSGFNVKTGGEGDKRIAIITAPSEGPLKGLSEPDAIAALTSAAGFVAEDERGFSSVGPTIQKETVRNAILGVIVSSILIVGYLTFRFGIALGGLVAGLRFGFSAIAALLHDVLFVVGFSAVVGYFAGWEISALFITSMLTVIGFSVHDSIVIFDRIRENLRKPKAGEDLQTLVNRSITQSFARSINTSMTTLTTLVILLIWGTTTPDLKLFCATMLAGIAVGTYSSIYNAAPILYLWDRAVARKKGEGETLVGMANAEIERNKVIRTQGGSAVADAGTTGTTGASGRTYGQVKRRANQAPSQRDIEEL